jgi:hypothetical protein
MQFNFFNSDYVKNIFTNIDSIEGMPIFRKSDMQYLGISSITISQYGVFL